MFFFFLLSVPDVCVVDNSDAVKDNSGVLHDNSGPWPDNSGSWPDNSGICSIILFPAALLRLIEVLLRPAILLYRKGVSRVYHKGVSNSTISAGNGVFGRNSACSGVIYGPLWPARGPLMAVYGGLRRLIWSPFGRLLVGTLRFQT